MRGRCRGHPLVGTLRADDLTALPRPTITAVKVEARPAIDGEVLNDPAWGAIAPAGGFHQSTPDPGALASEQTEVRIAYTIDIPPLDQRGTDRSVVVKFSRMFDVLPSSIALVFRRL